MKLHAGIDVVLQPTEDLLTVEVVAVGVAQREIVGADLTIGVIGNRETTDVSAAQRPAGAALGEQSAVLGLDVERNHAHAAQVGQLRRRLPMQHRSLHTSG